MTHIHQRFAGLLGLLGVTPLDDDSGPGIGKPAGDLEAQPLAGTGYERDPAMQGKHVPTGMKRFRYKLGYSFIHGYHSS